MSKGTVEWIGEVAAATPAVTKMAFYLEQPGVRVGPNDDLANVVDSIPFVAEFTFPEGATTHLFFQLMERESDSDVTITDMQTEPEAKRNQGFGKRAIKIFLMWARGQKLSKVKATQVSQADSIRFWEKQGFIRCPEPNPTGDYIKHL